MKIATYGTAVLLAFSSLVIGQVAAFHSCSNSITATRVSNDPIIDQNTVGISLTYPASPKFQWPTMFWPPDWVRTMTPSPFPGLPSDAKVVWTLAKHDGKRLYWGWSRDMATFPLATTNGGDLPIVWKEGTALNINHWSSPEFYFDGSTNSVYLFFHVCCLAKNYVPVDFSGRKYTSSNQATLMAQWNTTLSKFVIYERVAPVTDVKLRAFNAAIGPVYIRIFYHQNKFFGLGRESNTGSLLIQSSSGKVEGPYKVIKRILPTSRHTSVQVHDNRLSVGFTRLNETPERARLMIVDVSSTSPANWAFTTTQHTLIVPELWWEGGNLTFTTPTGGASATIERNIRDPGVFYDRDGVGRVVYCGGGEYAIGLANITCTLLAG